MDLAQREPEGWRGWRWDCRWKQAVELSRCEWVKADVRPILREGREESQEVTKHRQDFSDRREGEGQEGQEAATISCTKTLTWVHRHPTEHTETKTGQAGPGQTPQPLTHIRSCGVPSQHGQA